MCLSIAKLWLKGIKEWLESTNGLNAVSPKLKPHDFMKTTMKTEVAHTPRMSRDCHVRTAD